MQTMIESLIKDLERIDMDVFTKQDVKDFLEKKIAVLSEAPIELNGVVLNPVNYEVVIDSKRIQLPKKQFKMLHYFLVNEDKCVSRNAILKNCWEDGVIVGDRTIDVHVCKIKKIIKNKLYIHTQKGIGYKLKSK